jgi:guanylate kinase
MTAVFIISAPSGSGKSTLVNEVRKLVPDLDFSISYTTRAPRGNERNGCEYFFVSRHEFEEMIKRDEFLEHADVFGHYYGTAKRFLKQAGLHGHDLLLDIDVQGAEQIKRKLPDAVSVFILPPDRRTLERRLRNRSVDEESVIERRLAKAACEIENYRKYDYILVNDRLEESIDVLKGILLAERLKRNEREPTGEERNVIARAERYRLRNVGDRLQPILASFPPDAAPQRQR